MRSVPVEVFLDDHRGLDGMAHREQVVSAVDALDARAFARLRLQRLTVLRRRDVILRALDDQHRDRGSERDVGLLDPEQEQSVHAVDMLLCEGACDGSAEAVSAYPGVLE